MRYFLNDYEDAVIREDDSGDRFVTLLRNGKLKPEINAGRVPHNGVAFGTIEVELMPISKEEYETFGKTWALDRDCKRVTI